MDKDFTQVNFNSFEETIIYQAQKVTKQYLRAQLSAWLINEVLPKILDQVMKEMRVSLVRDSNKTVKTVWEIADNIQIEI